MIAQEINNILSKINCKIATAESCTGGLIADKITDIPGSSKYFLGGVVSYDNDIKMNILKVPEQIITEYGAVSKQTARYMADGIKNLFEADITLATTGIAGPDGGTEEKPVGLVYIAVASDDIIIDKYIFDGARIEIKQKIANQALLNLLKEIKRRFKI